MEAAGLARAAAAGRVAIGAALLAAPEAAARRWIGPVSDQPGAQVAVAGLGARDLALGIGTLWSLGGRDPRPWLIASGVADAADLLSAVRRREGLTAASVAVTAAIAGGSAVLHAWLQSELAP